MLVLVCAAGIRKGAVGMVHLYSPEVQSRCVELGLTTHEIIRRNKLRGCRQNLGLIMQQSQDDVYTQSDSVRREIA